VQSFDLDGEVSVRFGPKPFSSQLVIRIRDFGVTCCALSVLALAALKYSNPEEFSDTISGTPKKEPPRRSSKLLEDE
jgi:hypothetical protein